nr:reverse transcriptase domain-containing protein [Tanacetum cinerariifolium]
MTTPRPFVTPRTEVLIPFIILYDTNDEVTTLHVRPAPPSLDYVSDSPDYSPDSNLDTDPLKDYSPDEDPIEIPLLPSSSLPPPSILPSSSSPSSSLFPSSSRKRSRSPSTPPPPLPLPLPPVVLPPPPQERIELVKDDIETLCARLSSVEQEIVTLSTRVGSLEQHDVEVRELREFQVTDRLEILELRGQTEYVETLLERSHDRAEAAEQLKMVELRSQVQDIKYSFWEIERHLETMTTPNQGMSFVELERIVERQEDKVAENASNKRKWEGDHGGSSSQQQNKGPKVIRAHIVRPSDKKGYVGNLPLGNKYKFHHTGRCTAQCGNCKRISHQTRDCRASASATTQSPLVAK